MGARAIGRSGVIALSVVVPLGPDECAWRALLGDLAGLPAGCEVLLVAVAGTNPPDDLATLAARMASSVVWHQAPRGRAAQQNAGAATARHPNLWFLHADSRLDHQVFAELAGALPQLTGRLGYFDLAFAADGPPWMRLNQLGARVRSRALGLPFGDQGLLLTRADFERLGGFDPGIGWGEDHDLVWRARRAGLRLWRLPATITTSARKYAEQGWFTTTFRHLRGTWQQARAFSRTRATK